MAALCKGSQPFPYDNLAGAAEHRGIDEVAHGSGARPSCLLDLREIERSRSSQPFDVSKHLLDIHERLRRGVHGFLDRGGADEAPSPLQEVVIDVDESLCHGVSTGV